MKERKFPADPAVYPIRFSETEAMTEIQVCRSNAGFYLGRMCWDEEYGFEDAGSRESDYFRSQAEAEAALKRWGEDDVGLDARNASENQWAYETGRLPDPQSN